MKAVVALEGDRDSSHATLRSVTPSRVART
jgi:hypothetical protein